MKELTLGLNFCDGHDTSVFSIFDDDLYGISQERLTRIKHDWLYPIDAIKEMLRYKRIDPLKVEKIYAGVATLEFKNLQLFDNSYESNIALRRYIQGDKNHLYIKELSLQILEQESKSKIKRVFDLSLDKNGREFLLLKAKGKKVTLRDIVFRHLRDIFPNADIKIKFFEHHLAHAYSSYFSSPFQDSLVLTFDGYGDQYFSKIYHVDQRNKNFREIGNSRNIFIDHLKEYNFTDNGAVSIGNIYSVFTFLLGFTPNADEGKVEALAAFGDPNNRLYKALMLSVHIDRINLSINFNRDRLNKLFEPTSIKNILKEISKEDIAAALQQYTQDTIIELLTVIKEKNSSPNLCLAGGVTANVIMNMKINQELFENIFIVPAMADDGLAQGVALMIKEELQKDITKNFRFPLMPYFGSSYTHKEVEDSLKKSNLRYKFLGNSAYIRAGEYIVDGKIGAIFQGRAEFGPRALGNRSIIADVRDKNIQKKINKEIKNRPIFQPFCPSILEEERERLFEKSYNNRHMTIAFKLKEKFAKDIPGAVHIDNSARVQFVSQEDNPHYHTLIKRVKELTGFGVIINTSFNKHGRTMVLTPQDAIVDFVFTNLDFMVIEGFWVER